MKRLLACGVVAVAGLTGCVTDIEDSEAELLHDTLAVGLRAAGEDAPGPLELSYDCSTLDPDVLYTRVQLSKTASLPRGGDVPDEVLEAWQGMDEVTAVAPGDDDARYYTHRVPEAGTFEGAAVAEFGGPWDVVVVRLADGRREVRGAGEFRVNLQDLPDYIGEPKDC